MQVPKKLYIETTTRCNLQCEKCIKQTQGNRIGDADLPFALFEKMLPELAAINTLVVNGIGEPLLYPHLIELITRAREVMPEEGVIGFQSNGVLLTKSKALQLVQAGVSTICFSLDSIAEDSQPALSPLSAPSEEVIARAISNIHQADPAGQVKIGLEIVVSKDNIQQLPRLVRWGGQKKVDYILVSHLFAYDDEMLEKSVFTPVTRAEFALWKKAHNKAGQLGIDLELGLQASGTKFLKTEEEKRALELISKLREEAKNNDIYLHWDHLRMYSEDRLQQYTFLFDMAEQEADEYGIELNLPPLIADDERSCLFIEEQAAFVSTGGEVMPCHFLWHSYVCMSGRESIEVEARSFGSLQDATLSEIWQQSDYMRFRDEVAADEYSRCWSCLQGPCPDLVNNNLLAVNDCYGSMVPCGHCRWSIGGLRCL